MQHHLYNRVEIEINLYWALSNPKLFEQEIYKFFDNYQEHYEIAVSVKTGHVILRATIKQGENK